MRLCSILHPTCVSPFRPSYDTFALTHRVSVCVVQDARGGGGTRAILRAMRLFHERNLSTAFVTNASTRSVMREDCRPREMGNVGRR